MAGMIRVPSSNPLMNNGSHYFWTYFHTNAEIKATCSLCSMKFDPTHCATLGNDSDSDHQWLPMQVDFCYAHNLSSGFPVAWTADRYIRRYNVRGRTMSPHISHNSHGCVHATSRQTVQCVKETKTLCTCMSQGISKILNPFTERLSILKWMLVCAYICMYILRYSNQL